jgi:hypothetical protein
VRRARELLGQRRDLLGSAQDVKRGSEDGRAREASGPRVRIGLPGQKLRREKNSVSFSFSNISKHFQMILNPLLNLNQTTQYKNSNATA